MLHASWRICSVSQFKVGDRVIIKGDPIALVRVIERFNIFNSDIVYFVDSEVFWKVEQIELEHVFNSPLYAEMR